MVRLCGFIVTTVMRIDPLLKIGSNSNVSIIPRRTNEHIDIIHIQKHLQLLTTKKPSFQDGFSTKGGNRTCPPEEGPHTRRYKTSPTEPQGSRRILSCCASIQFWLSFLDTLFRSLILDISPAYVLPNALHIPLLAR